MRLANVQGSTSGGKIQIQELPFRIVFETRLQNGYELKDMTRSQIREFHRFVAETIYKGLSISKVDQLFLRKQGLSDAPPEYYKGKELLHYGKDRHPFRLFGYYNQDGYFVVCRIDGGHKTHKS